MAISPNVMSAKIYRFEARKRTNAFVPAGGARVVELRPAMPGIVYCAGASYHEAAIAEDGRSRKM